MAAITADRLSQWTMQYCVKPCAIAGFFVLVAFLWTLLFQQAIAYPFLFLFIGAGMGSAWFGGIIAGFIAVGLSSLLVDYFFVLPFFSMSMAPPSQTYLGAFVICAIAMTLVSAAQPGRSARRPRSTVDEGAGANCRAAALEPGVGGELAQVAHVDQRHSAADVEHRRRRQHRVLQSTSHRLYRQPDGAPGRRGLLPPSASAG